jgi:hypothetical protein
VARLTAPGTASTMCRTIQQRDPTFHETVASNSS